MHTTRSSHGAGVTDVSVGEYSERSGGHRHPSLHGETMGIQPGSGGRQMIVPYEDMS